jgi:transcriptional regulator with XRE-family HTH domain
MMAQKGLSQSDVARGVGYTPTAIWNWLRGNTLPRAETLTVLANLLDANEDWLRDGDALTPDLDAAPEQLASSETIADKVESLRAEIAALAGYELDYVRVMLEIGPR